MTHHITGICLSARYDEEIKHISTLINNLSPNTKIVRFKDILNDINLLDDCDFIFTIGGDCSVAWLVGEFFKKYGEKLLNRLKPIVPVVRPNSVGYLKQLDFDKKKFKNGFKKLINHKFTVLNRIVLKTTIHNKQYLAVNEINFSCYPQLGKITVMLKNKKRFHPITSTMADGVFIVTPIGSTGWALSYGGQIMLDEESIEIVFAGGIHSSGNFILPRRQVKVELEIKNLSVNPETVKAFEGGIKRRNIIAENDPTDILNMVYGQRLIIDGKLIAFDINEVIIDPSFSIPLVFLTRETTLDKARKLTRQKSVK